LVPGKPYQNSAGYDPQVSSGHLQDWVNFRI